MRKTKIVCTLGPATDNEEVLRQLMLHGMAVARINMSHQTQEEHKRRADTVKKLREELNLPVALLLDTKGPEIRTGTFKDKKVELVQGQSFILTIDDVEGDEKRCSISFKSLPKEVSYGSKILIDDGLIELKVEKCTAKEIYCTVINGGIVSSNKGINVPGVKLSLPFLNEKDKNDIKFAVEQDFDFIAASFTRSAEDILLLRAELEKHSCDDIRIISKIENIDGVNNIDDIIRVSDGIMVARGDLGVEIPLEEVPIIQKELIHRAYRAGKQVITATQMLDSMIKNPRPTRAESTDVANAVYDGTSALMLSGETAAGMYPVEALETMAKIAERTENDINYISRFAKSDINKSTDITSAISHATCTTAHDLGAAAIMTVSKSGNTARMISKYRPAYPIISGTTSKKVQRQMNLSWGVIPIMVEQKNNTDELFEHVIDVAEKQNLVHGGDIVVITAGVPLGVPGTTNLLKVHLVGNVLVSGNTATNGVVYGNACVCANEKEALTYFKKGDILVIPHTTNEILPLIRQAKGIITEEDGIDSHGAIVSLTLNKPIVLGAKNATRLIKDGVIITVDANAGLVYAGKRPEVD